MKRKNGFTLIELLVVVSIIALLVSILLPALHKAREQTKLVLCATNQRNIIQAVNIYQADHEGNLPPSNQCNQPNGNLHWTVPMRLKYWYGTPWELNGGSVTETLGEYMESGEYFDCPAANHDVDWQNLYLQALQDETVEYLNCSYFLLWNWKMASSSNPPFNPVKNGHTLMTCDLMLYDSVYVDDYNNATALWIAPHKWQGASKMPFADQTAGGTLNDGFTFWMEDDLAGSNQPMMPMNAGYLDGSVERISSEDYVFINGTKIIYLPESSLWR